MGKYGNLINYLAQTPQISYTCITEKRNITGCFRQNLPCFGRMFLRLYYINITKKKKPTSKLGIARHGPV
jgi:hypothetical protein